MPVPSFNNWIVLQQRLVDRSTDFRLPWDSYRNGFGNETGSFWMGLEKAYQATQYGQCQARFEMFNELDQWISVEYGSVRLESETGLYRIHVTGYTGDLAVDPMNCPDMAIFTVYRVHDGMLFTTIDRDNDNYLGGSCASDDAYGGGWWWNNCHCFCLNGLFDRAGLFNSYAFGYNTDTSNPYKVWMQLKQSRMMIKCNWSSISS